MRDLGKRLKMNSFEETYLPKIVEWLPDKRPTTIYVKNAIDAIFSLLSNKKIMREENLSFPNKDDPTSLINNPPIDLDTLITELHHGKWWTHSWKRKIFFPHYFLI